MRAATALALMMAACPVTAQEPAELSWTDEDRAEIMMGTWWDKVTPFLPPMDEPKAEVSSIPMADSDSPAVDPLPEDYENVHEYFLPDYIQPGNGLIDPQKLLTEVEGADVVALIEQVREYYGINLYVSVFAAGQKVPASVNAPAVSRQIFKQGARNLLLHFHVGDLKSAQVAFDDEVSARLGDEGRRELLYRVKQDASVYTYPQDELMAAMVSLVERSRTQVNAGALPTTEDEAVPERVGVPRVDIDLGEEKKVEESSFKEMVQAWKKYAMENVMGIVLHLGGLLALIGAWLSYRNLRVVRLLPSEPDKRLGAPNGASQSRPVNFRTQDRFEKQK